MVSIPAITTKRPQNSVMKLRCQSTRPRIARVGINRLQSRKPARARPGNEPMATPAYVTTKIIIAVVPIVEIQVVTIISNLGGELNYPQKRAIAGRDQPWL